MLFQVNELDSSWIVHFSHVDLTLTDLQASLGLWARALRRARKVRVSSCSWRPARVEEGRCWLQLSCLLARRRQPPVLTGRSSFFTLLTELWLFLLICIFRLKCFFCFADDVSFCFDLQNKANCWNSAFSTCVSTTFGLRYLVSFTAGNELIKLTHSPSQHCRGCHGDVMPWTAQLCCRACWENYPQWNPDDDGRSRWAWDWGRTQSVSTFDPPKAEN